MDDSEGIDDAYHDDKRVSRTGNSIGYRERHSGGYGMLKELKERFRAVGELYSAIYWDTYNKQLEDMRERDKERSERREERRKRKEERKAQKRAEN